MIEPADRSLIPGREKANVLLVGNHASGRSAIDDLLGGLQENLVHALSVNDALDYLVAHDAAVILLDAASPGADSFEDAHTIRAQGRSVDTPILFLNIADRNENAAKVMSFGPADYLPQPVTADTLRPKIQTFVDLYRDKLEMQRQREFISTVLDTVDSLVVVVDVQGRILRVNRAWEDALGYSASQAVGKPVSDFMASEDKGAPDFFRRVSIEPHFEDSWTTKSGDTRRIAWRSIQCASGQTCYFIASGADITEQTRLQQEGRARTDELEGFTYSVSHDLRAPIRAIDGFTRIITEEYSQQMDDEGRRLLEIVRLNTHRMGELIDGLLALSRIGREPMRTAEVDMEAMARTLIEEQRSAAGPGRQIEFKLHTPIPSASGDKRLIAQVFENLISNAVKFTRERKPAIIEIGARKEPHQTVYFVQDNGVGFDFNYVHKLFGTFQRLHPITEFEGTGIGLATVRRIVERHGGAVWADSKEGSGAIFYFALPRQDAKKAG